MLPSSTNLTRPHTVHTLHQHRPMLRVSHPLDATTAEHQAIPQPPPLPSTTAAVAPRPGRTCLRLLTIL